jgi:hypothetical protein
MDIVSRMAAAARATPRYDMYAGIHKALRAFMGDTLAMVGRCDWQDEIDASRTLAQLGELLAVCEVHVHDENVFVHPAIEARRPGVSARVAGEHEHNLEEIHALRHAAAELGRLRGAARGPAAHALQLELALFVAANFVHMNHEETVHNAALREVYTDAELAAIEAELVATIPPEAMELIAPWMLRNLCHQERVALLSGMREGAPAEVFEGMLALAASQLPARDWAKLAQAIDVPLARAA